MEWKDAVCDVEEIHGEAVERVSRAMLPESEVQGLAGLFKILGDPTRIRIVWALDQAELCVCDLAATLAMTTSAVSHQLNKLRQAKLVKYRREGKNVYYGLDDEHVTQLVEVALTHFRHD